LKNPGMVNRDQIPAMRPISADTKAITKTPPMYQCGQNGRLCAFGITETRHPERAKTGEPSLAGR
jgi:hypothetical protein